MVRFGRLTRRFPGIVPDTVAIAGALEDSQVSDSNLAAPSQSRAENSQTHTRRDLYV